MIHALLTVARCYIAASVVYVFIAVAPSQARGATSPLTTERRRGLLVGQTAGRVLSLPTRLSGCARA